MGHVKLNEVDLFPQLLHYKSSVMFPLALKSSKKDSGKSSAKTPSLLARGEAECPHFTKCRKVQTV